MKNFIPTKLLLEIILDYLFEASPKEILSICRERLPENEVPTAEWLREHLKQTFSYNRKLRLSPHKPNSMTNIIDNNPHISIKRVRKLLIENLGSNFAPSSSTIRRYKNKKKAFFGADNISSSMLYCENDKKYFSEKELMIFLSSLDKLTSRTGRPRLSDKDFLIAIIMHYRDKKSWASMKFGSVSGQRFYRRLFRWKVEGFWDNVLFYIEQSGEDQFYDLLEKSR